MDKLEIINLHAEINGKKILKGVNLTIRSGEIHAIMGPNGSGKSTLCNVLMNHPKYEVTKGKVLFNGKNILNLSTDERARLGIFLGFQHPIEIPGVSFNTFLRNAKNSLVKKPVPPLEFLKKLKAIAKSLKMKEAFIERPLNEGFSGGEKKRAEIVQMSILEPKVALLDEIDSGLDIDALRIVAEGIKTYFKKNSPAILLITHYQRLLNHITPHFVHIMSEGEIIKSGDKKLALKIEKEGYEKYIK